jgi:uncharacterized protein (TIGR04255 family)
VATEVLTPQPAEESSLERQCYRRPFLTQVVLRVDLLNFIDALVANPPSPSVMEAVRLRFPIPEPAQTVENETQILGQQVQQRERRYTTWNFHGKNREKLVSFTPNVLLVLRSKYSTYEEMKEDFLAVFNSFTAAYPDTVVNRVGLRYVNEIVLDEAAPTNWTDYIDDHLIRIFEFFPSREHLSRLFSVSELNYGELQLRFQFGMHNPDYPAPIKRKSFILDLDAYTTGMIENKGVEPFIDNAHAKIQDLFERSITAKLRKRMDEQS